jgi:hypothetical protein
MANRELKDRGSRKHVLDLVEAPQFTPIMNTILARSGFRLADNPHIQPFGRQNADAWSELEIEEYLADEGRRFPSLAPIPSDWWIKHRTATNRSPTWDLIAHLQSLTDVSQNGLLLVEAKANLSELKIKDAKSDPTGSDKSLENHERIQRQIQEAKAKLNGLGCGPFSLSEADHYQLANRLACSVRLAEMGYRVVLLYLGFTGDTYFRDPIEDESQWQRAVGGYLQGVVPQAFPEKDHPLGNGSLRLVVQSRPVIEVSRP